MDSAIQNSNGIQFAWTFDGQGGGKRIELNDVSREIHNVGLAWVHINDSGFGAREWIEKEISYLDRIILDALLEEETHPRYLDFQTGALLILRGINLNPGQRPEDMVSVRVWVDEHRIITIERRKVFTIYEIDKSIEAGRGPKEAGEFLTMLTGHLFDHIDDTMAIMHDKLDITEDKLLERPDDVSSSEVTSFRRAAMAFHRFFVPQRDVINELRRAEKTWLNDVNRRDFSEDFDKITRLIESADFLRDRARIVYEELITLATRKTNNNLYLLSGIATIFMPLTFITGLLGMNVEGIPGAHTPDAFYLVTLITLIFGIMLAGIFKWLKWF